ncbi:MAG: HAMP domain-containing histidine kinase [Chitinophagaceae bacterium]|nr:HAMP domain-containing histidine kinase [Chitinophagaceae bacterium]MCW5904000.1 HAMP domain-containing histidine kinase [Chitinophagaceae bacterium]
MEEVKQHKYLVHYFLIACTVLIQIIILVFFYNEYFNGKKLYQLETQIQEAHQLRSALEKSKEDIFSAQTNLQDYVRNNQKKSLENYFLSLKNLSKNLNSIDDYKKKNIIFNKAINSQKEELTNLPNLQTLIDSVYIYSSKKLPKNNPFKIENFEIKDSIGKVDINIKQILDSLPKKKLFARLRDAFKNDVTVKKEITIITTKYGDTLNSVAIKNMIDSILEVVNLHYVNELKKIQTYSANTNYKYEGIYKIYDQLITFSNQWMEVYSTAINDFNQNLEVQYAEHNSKTNKIRRYSVLGLMILMFLVLAVIIYYTRQAFQYEKELQKANRIISKNLNFKNRILGMLSHEIRSPLRIINLFIDRISKRNKDEKVAAHLDTIKFTNNSLLIQASQVLEYAKNEEKEIEVNHTRVILKNEIDAILNSFQPYIEHKSNIFEWKNQIVPNMIVLADKVKIHQIFTNILGNANKFTENGTIVVNVKTESNPNYEILNVVISDTGIGISESDLSKIFEPYYQGIISDKIENIGAGLGLNLCKEIIDKLGGEITVNSTLNKGTTVSFKLNLERTE